MKSIKVKFYMEQVYLRNMSQYAQTKWKLFIHYLLVT